MKRAIFIAALLLSSCATSGKFKSTMDSWVGRTADDMVASWGPPQSSYRMSDGRQVLQWSRSGSFYMPGMTTTRPVTTYNSGTVNAYGTGGYGTANYAGTSTTYLPVQSPGYNIPMTCTVRMTVSPQGVVTSWASQGNHCVN